MNAQTPNNPNDMSTAQTHQFSNRRWSIVLFLAVLVGIAQFGLGQFSPWVIAAPFVALLVMDVEGAVRGRQGDKETARRGEGGDGVLTQAATAFVFHGLVIGAVMTAVGDSAQHSSGRFVMAKSAGAGCGSGGMCGGGQAAVGTLTSSATTKSGCGSGGCSSAAGGCGSGGCGAGGQAAGGTLTSSATGKSACGCGGGAKAGDAKAMMVQIPSDAAKMQNANQMRPGLPPIMARPNGTAAGVTNERLQAGSLHHLGMPGVTNQPIAISPQAMSVVSAQPKTTVPRPGQGPMTRLPTPIHANEGNQPPTGATAAPPKAPAAVPAVDPNAQNPATPAPGITAPKVEQVPASLPATQAALPAAGDDAKD